MPEQALKPLDSYKRDAARLLKAIRAREPAAILRFTVLDNPPGDLQLKHALAMVAHEAGYDGWTALKQAVQGVDFAEIFAAPGLKDSINHWYATYDEAKTHQSAHGGVLLPYRHQAFVTSLEVLPRMGYEKDDPDWQEIGYDFIKPASQAAYVRIKTKLVRRFFAPE